MVPGDGNLGDLCLAADQFVINTGRGTSIIAGYQLVRRVGERYFHLCARNLAPYRKVCPGKGSVLKIRAEHSKRAYTEPF